MRITIEIDGKHVVAIDVTNLPDGATLDSLAHAEPPPELLEAARARGAQSAGPAASVRAGGAAQRRPGELAGAPPATPVSSATGAGGDLDAGRATVADVTEMAAPPPVPRRPARARGVKRGR
jgi:hypothetical protein